MEDYAMNYRYTLESHLKKLCELNNEYQNLYDTWELNKKTCCSILKTVVMNFPHYSLHDDTHSENIIDNIEMLLGEDRIKRLSPTETWMILHCAYLHDFGMAVLCKSIENQWGSEEFKEYINDTKVYGDKDMIKAINYIENLDKNLQDESFEIIWPLKIRTYVTYIVADYFRSKHSSLTKEYLDMISEWGIDISHAGLIQDRLIKLIGEISLLHTKSFDEVRNLDYQANGYKSDYIHPRFIAEMLRIGDLLDLDNGRFCEYFEKVNGKLPETSEEHKKKHKSTRHILVTPQVIEITADCPDNRVYRQTRSWFDWIDDEINNMTIYWTEIIPKNLGGYAPKFQKRDILLNGRKDINNLIDLKFEISQEKAFGLLEGSNIYKDNYVFIREFIQNAVDASKIQLWRDLKNEVYSSPLNNGLNIGLSNIMPFDIKKEIYDNYTIEIETFEKKNDVEIVIRDRGTGISIDTLKSMSKVGSSYNGNKRLKKEILEMPAWLRPTGGFGVGLQSAFLVNDNFNVYTKSEGSDPIEIIFKSRKETEGYIQVHTTDKNIKRGSEFHISIPKNNNLSYSLGGYAYDYIKKVYDPFGSNNIIAYKIIDIIAKNFIYTLFPLKAKIENCEHEFTTRDLPILKLKRSEFKSEGKYLYKMSNKLDEIKFWDTDECVYIHLNIREKSSKMYRSTMSFKGIYVNGQRYLNDELLYINIDIYGFDTKESLKLNREELKFEALSKVNDILYECEKIYIKILDDLITQDWEKINNDWEKINKFSFIILASTLLKDFNIQKYIDKFNKTDSYLIKVIKKTGDNYELKDIEFRDIFNEYPNLLYIDLDYFHKINGSGINYDLIKETLAGSNEDLEEDTIIVDEKFIQLVLNKFIVKEIKVVEKNNKIIIYKIDNNNSSTNIKVDRCTKNYFMRLLIPDKDNKKYGMYDMLAQRVCIPAIEGYDKIVTNLSNIYGLGFYKCNCYKIISPLLQSDREKLKEYVNVESFVESITNRDDYKRLIEYTINHNILKEKISKDDIDQQYRKLIKEYFQLIKQEDI